MYSIGEISKMVKVSIDALRYYDAIGLLKPQHIEEKNHYRYYSEEQISDVLFIIELKQYGFSLDAIKELMHCTDINRLQDAFYTRLKQLYQQHCDIENTINILKKRITELKSEDRFSISNKRILIVDDVPFMRNILRDYLGNHGFTIVGETANGCEGVKKYFEVNPDIIIMNIEMPEMNGIEAVRIIKEEDPKARIVMCSAKGNPAAVMQSIQEGASDFVVKPFQPDYLKEVINKNLDEIYSYNHNTISAILKDKEITNKFPKKTFHRTA